VEIHVLGAQGGHWFQPCPVFPFAMTLEYSIALIRIGVET